MTATQAINKYCRIFCCNGYNPKTHCVSESCPLYSVSVLKDPKKSKLRLIRERCLNCVGTNSFKDVEECKCKTCALFLWRFGKNINIKPESKEKARKRMLDNPERLEKMRAAREQKDKKEKIKKILLAGNNT